jgi:predicted alpha/beta superfamily hydrolase
MIRRQLLTAGLAAAAFAPTVARALSPVPPPMAPPPPRPMLAGTTFEIPDRSSSEVRRVTVWTPPGYDQGSKRYPVLYLLDGGPEQDYLPVVGLAALGSLNGVTQEMIVVGVESGAGLRARDFTTRSTDAAELKDFPRQGRAPVFRAFLTEELKPWIEKAYRTNGQSALMGESLAAYFVVDTALREPGRFTHYIAISPSLWWSDQALSREAAGLLKQPWPKDRRLYLAIANEGGTMQSGMDRLVGALKAGAPAELTWTYEPFPNERHHSIYHPAGLNALRWAFPGPEAIK